MEGLHNFRYLIEALRATNSRNEKKEILQKIDIGDEEKKLLKMVLDPFKKFNVTRESILKHDETRVTASINVRCNNLADLRSFLHQLNNREISGHDALDACCVLLVRNDDHREVLLSIFDKDLKIGIGATDINKIWKNFVPTYDVCLAQPTTKPKKPTLLQDHLDKINQEPDQWCIQRKLDGLRCIIEYKDGVAVAKSRNGLEFPALKKLTDEIEKFMGTMNCSGDTIVFDGEVCVVDEDGNEDFSAAVSQVKRKSVIMKNPRYLIFDILPLGDFAAKTGDTEYFTRAHTAKILCEKYTGEYFKYLGGWAYSEANFKNLMKMAKEKGWEGLMLRKDVGYEGKRTKNLLKVKIFEVEEFVVKSVNNDTIQMTDPETSLRRAEETFKSVNVEFDLEGKKGFATVGTGWSQVQRRHYFKHPEEIIGKTISVQFQEYCEDSKTGIPSLRIPSLAHIWENGRDV